MADPLGLGHGKNRVSRKVRKSRKSRESRKSRNSIKIRNIRKRSKGLQLGPNGSKWL